MQVYIPQLKPIPNNATKQDRIRMHEEYVADLIKFNPGRFNPDGTVKSLWQSIKGLFNE